MQPGLREQKKKSTTRAVQEAALVLYAERGLEHTTVDDLCARAEVSRRTFFRYFDSKQDAVLGRLKIDIDTVSSVFAEAADTEKLDVLLARAVTAVVTDQDDLARFIEVVVSGPELRGAYLGMLAAFEDALRELIAQRLGTCSDQAQVRLIAAAAVTGYRVGIETWLTERHEHDLRQLVHHNIDIMTTSLLARPGSVRDE